MNKLLLVLVALAAVSAETNFEKFNDYILKYERKYSTLEEFEYRFKVFEQTLERVALQNREHVAIGGGEVFGVNVFADQTVEEFSVRLMKDLPPREPQRADPNWVQPVGLATDIDWRNYGVVSPVKDQGQCGSCWAHSADEAIESFYAIYTVKANSTKVFSVQQCTACTYSYDGCNGGWPHDAYVYAVEDRNGIDLDSDYPYNIAQAGNCKFGASGNADKPAANVQKYASPAQGQLQNLLSATGPVSVCVAAEAWQTYTGGILKSCAGSVDHCVQATGYTTSASESYWVVRNSWGTGWGIKGYIYLDMTTMNGDICHIQEYMTYPTTMQ